MICPNGKVTNTSGNGIQCECDKHFKLNDTTKRCQLEPICGENGIGRNDCHARNAYCFTDETKLGEYKCICPFGKFPENHKDKSIDVRELNSTCIDFCSLKEQVTNCSQRNAKCDPTKILSKLMTIKDPNDIFKNNINSDDYCVCSPGYIMKGKWCVIATFTAEFNLTIKNTFFDSNNNLIINKKSSSSESNKRKKRDTEIRATFELDKLDEKFKADYTGFMIEMESQNIENKKFDSQLKNFTNMLLVENYLLNELIRIFKNAEYFPSNGRNWMRIRSCERNGDFFNCQFSINMDRKLEKGENLGSKILNQCDPVTGDTKLCAFQKDPNATKPTYPDFSQNDIFSLIIDQESAGKTFFKKHDVRNFVSF
jgi:hypothetical protein